MPNDYVIRKVLEDTPFIKTVKNALARGINIIEELCGGDAS